MSLDNKNKKIVAILAPTGMLGSVVYDVLKDKYKLLLIYRDKEKLKLLDQAYGLVADHQSIKFDLFSLHQDFINGFNNSDYGPITQKLAKILEPADFIINCAGIIKPYAVIKPELTMFINGALPHLLSSLKTGRLIQITTDCAFSGITGAPYNEASPKTPADLYGLSKVMGEPASAIVLRTSIIGPEIHGFISLIEWFKSQQGKTISGYKNHFWNGITTKQFGKICHQLMSDSQLCPPPGTYHIFSTTVSKYEMLKKFQEKYQINCKILADEKQKINRTLSTIHDLNSKLNIPSFAEMLVEL